MVGKLQIFSFQHCRCAPPQVVAFPESVEQVSGVAKLCNEHRVPLIPFGSGTGLEGGSNAIRVSSWNILFMYKETHVTSLSLCEFLIYDFSVSSISSLLQYINFIEIDPLFFF